MLVIAVWLELDTLIVATKEIWKSRKRWSRSQSSKTSNNMPLKRQQMMKRWYEMEWSTIIGQEMSASIGLAFSLLSLSYENLCVCTLYRYSNNHSLSPVRLAEFWLKLAEKYCSDWIVVRENTVPTEKRSRQSRIWVSTLEAFCSFTVAIANISPTGSLQLQLLGIASDLQRGKVI